MNIFYPPLYSKSLVMNIVSHVYRIWALNQYYLSLFTHLNVPFLKY